MLLSWSVEVPAMTLPSSRPLTLRRLEAFRALSAAETDALDARGRQRWLEPGDALFTEGEASRAVAIVLVGELAVSLRGAPGSPTEVASLGPGAVVGEGALVDPAPRSATVTAAVPSVVVELDRADFAALAREQPGAASHLLGMILRDVARKLRAVEQRVAIELGEVSAFPPLTPPPGAPDDAGPAPGPAAPTVTPDALRRSGFALPCDDAELAALVGACRARRFAAGEVLSQQGTEARSCFILVEGSVAVVKSLLGAERALTTLGPGAMAGQVALIARTRRASSLRALTPVLALELGREPFDRLLAASSPVALGLQRQLATAGVRQLREADRLLAAVLARGARRGGRPSWEPGASPGDRDRRDLEYIGAAAGEIDMNLDVVELTDDDLLDDAAGPPPLPTAPR
jgi:CRP-like cAMP-binding protein